MAARRRNARQCQVSGRDRAQTRQHMRLGLADRIVEHCAARQRCSQGTRQNAARAAQGRVDAFPPKPEAPVTLHVMEALGADPSTTLYVGDSNVDILTGHNAGLKSAGVSWGFRGRAELESAGADYVMDTQDELAALILGE